MINLKHVVYDTVYPPTENTTLVYHADGYWVCQTGTSPYVATGGTNIVPTVGSNTIGAGTDTSTVIAGAGNTINDDDNIIGGNNNAITILSGKANNNVVFGTSNTLDGTDYADVVGYTNSCGAGSDYCVINGANCTIGTASSYSTCAGANNVVANFIPFASANGLSAKANIPGQNVKSISNVLGVGGSQVSDFLMVGYAANGLGIELLHLGGSYITFQSNSIVKLHISVLIGCTDESETDHNIVQDVLLMVSGSSVTITDNDVIVNQPSESADGYITCTPVAGGLRLFLQAAPALGSLPDRHAIAKVEMFELVCVGWPV
jgi:hypothetical protein